MSSKHVDSPSLQSPDWDRAWDLVCRLASTHRDLAAKADGADIIGLRVPSLEFAPTETLVAPVAEGAAAEGDEFQRAVAEIERASTALRQAEPALESWPHEAAPVTQSQRPRLLWLVIAALWVSTGLAVAGAVTVVAAFVQ